MNIIFFGSSKFAVPALRSILAAGHKISCVVTQPDRKKGRGLHIEGTQVKKIAQDAGLEIYQPQRINTAEALKFLKSLSPDLLVVISYGQILSEEILSAPKLFAINAHASLLPKYRGAAPISRAIIKDDHQTGVTIIKITKDMDAGPIMIQKQMPIQDNDTVITLEEKLSSLAAELAVEALRLIKDNKQVFNTQDKEQVTFAPKLRKEDGLINWDKPAKDLSNLIKGCFNWPGAFSYYKDKMVKIYSAMVTKPQSHKVTGSPGEIIQVDKDGIVVATGKDNLVIQELQIEGKRKMSAQEFILGHKIKTGDFFKHKKV